MKLDLHVHSAASPDGVMEISEIVRIAKERGLDGVAICDHDVFYSGDTYGGYVIRGCEYSTEYGHLLALGMENEVKAHSFETLIEGIHAAGGIAVLAHPYEHLKYKDKIEEIAHLLDGVEVYNSRAERKNKDANRMALDYARRHDLSIYGGSDAHTPAEVGNTYTVSDNVKCGGITVHGKASPALATAKSQRAKIKKQGGSRLRWTAFAIKCLLQDIFTRRDKDYVTYSKDR